MGLVGCDRNSPLETEAVLDLDGHLQRVHVVKVPVRLQTDVFAAALREVLEARAVSYEFNGSVGVVAPVIGIVRVPFSRTGTIDPMDILRRKGISFN